MKNIHLPHTSDSKAYSRNTVRRREFLFGVGESALGAGAACLAGSFIPFGIRRCHAAEGSEIGRAYEGWREGELEIHSIYTGRGESTFYIFPDGTTMLLDAGDWYTDPERSVEYLPNDSRRSGEWIARYVQRANPHGTDVDYMMASHFHVDHIGSPKATAGITEGRGDDYHIAGLSQVAETIHFDWSYDRGYPDYNDPADPVGSPGEVNIVNYRKFLKWTMKEKGLRAEKFNVGQLDQIKLRKTPGAYDFHVRNLSANGEVWTGKGEKTFDFLAGWNTRLPNENPLSIGLLMTYGNFRYFTGGDTDTNVHVNNTIIPVEAAVGNAAGPVDVCKANHHGVGNASGEGFIKGVQPRVMTFNIWVTAQADSRVLDRFFSDGDNPIPSGERLACPTMFPKFRQEEIANAPWCGRVATMGGHIVVKVFDGGRQFKVYYLSARDEKSTVTAVFGPFESTGTQRAAKG